MSRRRARRETCRSQQATAELERLYAALPALACRGLCVESCAQHIDASPTERDRIADRGVDLDRPTPDGSCPALSRALGRGHCTVHDIRPMVCRLWGIAASMPCPHGCHPDRGPLSDADTLRLMLNSLEVGGHRDDATRAVLEQCLHDPVSAALMARFLRGDRTMTSELRSRLTRDDRKR